MAAVRFCERQPNACCTKAASNACTDYPKAIENCLADLKGANALHDESELSAVGFKVVIAKDLTGCVRLDDRVLQAMSDYNGLAPAHNPPYITGIKLFAQRMPKVAFIGLFETAFHQVAPEAIDALRRTAAMAGDRCPCVGVFMGPATSSSPNVRPNCLCRPDVAERARQLYVNHGATKISGAPLRVISCHLGGSSSVTGILNGASIGTSMGMSPQSGLPQNNRVGDLDAEALPYAAKMLGLTMEDAQKQLSKLSGLLGLSGVSNDVRDVAEAAASGNVNAKLALDVFTTNARHWLGSYFLQLNGADAIVFTAGTGENRADLRAAICANLENLGILLDPDKNNSIRATEAVISATNSAVKIFVVPTNEELVVAREAKRFLEAHQN